MIPLLLERILEFLDQEADNRALSGSEMSDYEREVRDLADELRDWLARSTAAPQPMASDGEATKPKAGATGPLITPEIQHKDEGL